MYPLAFLRLVSPFFQTLKGERFMNTKYEIIEIDQAEITVDVSLLVQCHVCQIEENKGSGAA